MLVLRIVALTVATISIFMLPWPVTLVTVLAAAITLPLSSVVLGVLVDVVYHAPGMLPWGTILGILGWPLGGFVHRFIKTRIMGT